MRWLLVLCAGCGRLAFDPAADAASVGASHDEDSDGIDDAIDVCPHLADSAQSDLDGDGVGDVCDPEPSLARQTRHVFFAMTPDNAPVRDAEWRPDPDAWRFSMDFEDGSFAVPASLSNADTWIGFDIVEIMPTPARQLYAAVEDGSDRFYYGEIYDDGTMSPRGTLLYYDSTKPVFFAGSVLLGASIPLGGMDYHLTTRTSPGPVMALDMSWSAMMVHTELVPADLVSFTGGNVLRVLARSMTLEVRYVFVVTTEP